MKPGVIWQGLGAPEAGSTLSFSANVLPHQTSRAAACKQTCSHCHLAKQNATGFNLDIIKSSWRLLCDIFDFVCITYCNAMTVAALRIIPEQNSSLSHAGVDDRCFRSITGKRELECLGSLQDMNL